MKGTPEARQKIITEAESWLRTPWHHQAAVKGAGVDCGQILYAVFINAGLIERSPAVEEQLKNYSRQWMLHRDEEIYLSIVEQFAHRVESPTPGGVAVWKNGRTHSHGAIIVNWPRVIHADVNEGVVYADMSDGRLSTRPVVFYSIFDED